MPLPRVPRDEVPEPPTQNVQGMAFPVALAGLAAAFPMLLPLGCASAARSGLSLRGQCSPTNAGVGETRCQVCIWHEDLIPD